jgi:hypothetical protein
MDRLKTKRLNDLCKTREVNGVNEVSDVNEVNEVTRKSGHRARSEDAATSGVLCSFDSMAGDFSDLVVWREAAALAADVIKHCRGLRGPGAASASDQMVRAAESIPANIAEAWAVA